MDSDHAAAEEPARPDLEAFARDSGLSFRDERLILEALTHRSYVNEHPCYDLADNQRLEFLGDAVLDLVVGEWLFRQRPEANEGDLTNVRASIVRTDTLARFGASIRLGQHLLLGKGEQATGGAERPANVCAAFEAVVGALYLDRGMDDVRAWLEAFLARQVAAEAAGDSVRDAKSRLQEVVQATLHVTPSYHIVGEEGPDHAKVFASQVLVDGQVWGQGQGSTKQAAEQAAAANALLLHPELR